MSRRRDRRHATPSETVLRQGAANVALDIARAPTDGHHHGRLAACTREFVGLDGAMTATSEALRNAGKHADTLRREASEWEQLEVQAPQLCDTLDAIVATVDPQRRKKVMSAPCEASRRENSDQQVPP